jgi:large subunit ribosomal protein L30
MAEKIRISLVKSTIGGKPVQKKTVKALGLGRINSSVVQEKNPVILGMVNVVKHLVEVEEIK